MAPYSSTLAWKIPWTEEPGRLQSMGSQRVGHDWATSLSLFTFLHWRRKWQPTLVFLPGEPRDGEAWWAAVYGVAQSRTRLKWLSSSSSRKCYIQSNVCCLCSVTKLCPILDEPHGMQHARLPCPSPSPRVCSSSRPLHQWCHATHPLSPSSAFSLS